MILVPVEAEKNTKNVAERKRGKGRLKVKFFNGFEQLRVLLLCIFSSVLLTLSFPQTNFYGLAFVALIPLLFALDGKSTKEAFKISYKTGWLFFVFVFYWIMLVPPEILTIFGLLALVSYLALYFGIFGVFYKGISQKSFTFKLVMLPCAWVLLEYIRGTFLSGFGWASLCHSQTRNLLLIQMADVTGMLGVSFFVVVINVFFKEVLQRYFLKAQVKRIKGDWIFPTTFVSLLCLAVFGYGYFCLKTYPSHFTQGMSVAIIQGNINQDDKLNQSQWEQNYQKYKELTELAAGQNPDLIIWPETALPGYINIDDSFLIKVKKFIKEIKIPVLLGTVENEGTDFFNSGLLIAADGEIFEKYRKVHLVPFGEYIPLRSIFPILSSIIPIGDFSASDEYTVFNQGKHHIDHFNSFAVHICFEDSIPSMAREFVNGGAEFLVNLTNDAWFKDTKAPFLHLQSSVFRAVENRRTLVRSANTGVSCFISPLGKVYRTVLGKTKEGRRERKSTFVEGFAIDSIILGKQRTFYSVFGDIFIFICVGFLFAGLVKMTLFDK